MNSARFFTDLVTHFRCGNHGYVNLNNILPENLHDNYVISMGQISNEIAYPQFGNV